jgi:hypothetical protein
MAAAPEVPAVPDDVVYGTGRMDESGRVGDRAMIGALGWRRGDRLALTAAAGVVIARRDAAGMVIMPAKRPAQHGPERGRNGNHKMSPSHRSAPHPRAVPHWGPNGHCRNQTAVSGSGSRAAIWRTRSHDTPTDEKRKVDSSILSLTTITIHQRGNPCS